MGFCSDVGMWVLTIWGMGLIIFVYQLFWPPRVLSFVLDKKGSCLGNKSTTLEMLGILILFVVIPEQLVNQHVIVKVENIACYCRLVESSCHRRCHSVNSN